MQSSSVNCRTIPISIVYNGEIPESMGACEEIFQRKESCFQMPNKSQTWKAQRKLCQGMLKLNDLAQMI